MIQPFSSFLFVISRTGRLHWNRFAQDRFKCRSLSLCRPGLRPRISIAPSLPFVPVPTCLSWPSPKCVILSKQSSRRCPAADSEVVISPSRWLFKKTNPPTRLCTLTIIYGCNIIVDRRDVETWQWRLSAFILFYLLSFHLSFPAGKIGWCWNPSVD